MADQKITTLFLDIGGVLLTNGWGRHSRAAAAEKFKLDLMELNERHHLTFDTYEMGKLTLDEYLKRTVFYQERNFSLDEFKSFMYAESKAFPDSIAFFKELKARHKLRVIAVNNEGRELNEYRIRNFQLNELFDAFASSCYVKFRKPDTDIFRVACDMALSLPEEAIMVDDRQMFVEVASSIGLTCVQFTTLGEVQERMKEIVFQW
ncbi:MAG TPA: HAD family hydrolase [Chitinophagaceae bacterium]|nr:HAD family hydrolase [Chitinophagaceae bacterium]